MTPYIIKSIIYLSIMYLPYMLLLRNESFFRFNRIMLLSIMLLSLVLPLCDFHFLSVGNNPLQGFVTVGLPVMISEGASKISTSGRNESLWQIIFGGSVVEFLSRLYFAGMIVTLLWKIVQVAILQREMTKGVLWKDEKDGVTIYSHAQNIAPYSWFSRIVISEDDYKNNAEEILKHEMGHIRHGHSWDILLLNIIQILQWANPLAWIIGISLRDVHEYEADDTVLTGGINARQYQTLLIRKAVGSSSYTFANSFNHSLLSKRITMMLRKKSSPWMRTKALYIIPVAVIALSAFATPELNNKVDNLVKPTQVSVGKVTKKSANSKIISKEIADTTKQKAETVQALVKGLSGKGDVRNKLIILNGKEVSYEEFTASRDIVDKIIDIKFLNSKDGIKQYGDKAKNGVIIFTTGEKNKDGNEAYDAVEEMPQYPGGMSALMQFLSMNVKYPKVAQDAQVAGRAIVKFIVEKDGSISDVEIINFSKVLNASEDKSASTGEVKVVGYAKNATATDIETAEKALKDEAVRVVKKMPSWTPGKQKGEPVRVKFVLPITFSLK